MAEPRRRHRRVEPQTGDGSGAFRCPAAGGAAYRLDLIAGYTTAAGGEAYAAAFEDEEAFLAFVAAARAESDFVSPVEVQPGDRLVTLSTCAYEFEHARYVVHARLTPLS